MILGIDLGSTVFKAALFDHALAMFGSGAAAVPCSIDGQRVELPVDETEAAFAQAIAAALRSASARPEQVRTIAIASQAQTFTIRTPAGHARLPFISWRDSRCEVRNRAAEELADFARHCGVDVCLPLLLVAKLAFLQDQACARLVEAGDKVLMLPTWFVQALTGRAVVDDNLAAMSGLYSLVEHDWWPAALQLCGIRTGNLPPLAPLGAVAGRTTEGAARFGLPPGLPVVLAGNDQTAGAYGAGIHEQAAILITLGTAQVAYAVQASLPPPASGIMRGPYPGGRFYQLVADDFGAGTVNWARSMLDGGLDEAAFDRAAGSVADCGGVRFVADGPAGRGHWLGETEWTTTAERARAVLVCLADRLATMLDRLAGAAGQPLLVAGGGSASAPWLACLEQRLGRPLERAIVAAPPVGAARLALAALR